MITQTPQVRNTISIISWVGDVYQIGGEEFDFSQLLDGEILPVDAIGTDLIVSDVTRVGTEINFVYVHTYFDDGTETDEDRFPPTLDNTGDSA